MKKINLKKLISFKDRTESKLVKTNLVFIFIFLNIWDFAVNHIFFNGMVLGILMFGPSAFLWVVGTVRSAALVTLISIFEFTMLVVFVAEGFETGGIETTIKSLFWVPYLLMAGVNGYWGLRIYSEYREKKSKVSTI